MSTAFLYRLSPMPADFFWFITAFSRRQFTVFPVASLMLLLCRRFCHSYAVSCQRFRRFLQLSRSHFVPAHFVTLSVCFCFSRPTDRSRPFASIFPRLSSVFSLFIPLIHVCFALCSLVFAHFGRLTNHSWPPRSSASSVRLSQFTARFSRSYTLAYILCFPLTSAVRLFVAVRILRSICASAVRSRSSPFFSVALAIKMNFLHIPARLPKKLLPECPARFFRPLADHSLFDLLLKFFYFKLACAFQILT